MFLCLLYRREGDEGQQDRQHHHRGRDGPAGAPQMHAVHQFFQGCRLGKYHDVRKQKRRYLVEAAALFEPSQRMLPIEHPTVNEGAIVRLDEFAVAADETVEPHTILLHQPLAKKIQFERHEKHRRDQIEQKPEKNITMIINAPSSVPSEPCSADGSAVSSVDLSGVNASSQPLHTSTTLPMLR